MVDFEKAKLNPASAFRAPHEVVEDKSLTREEKIEILKRWAYDEREMAVAEEENMLGPAEEKNACLDEILRSLLELGIESDQKKSPPTKQG